MIFMGLKFKDIVTPVVVPIQVEDISKKIIGIDVYNYTYVYLKSIQNRDGTPLSYNGHITSHISGFFYKIIELLKNQIKPVFVFDGKPENLKSLELDKRREKREEIIHRANMAKESGDLDLYNRIIGGNKKIDDQIIEDLKKLIELFGCPHFTAVSDAECEIAKMTISGDVDICVSQDYDSLLFGSRLFLRNFLLKEYMNIRGMKIKLEKQMINLNDLLEHHEISLDQLIDIGILSGTDFNEKIPRIGPKTALKMVKKYGDALEAYQNEDRISENISIDTILNVRTIFNKKIEKKYDIKFNTVDDDGLESYLSSLGFNSNRVKNKIDELYKKRSQTSLFGYF